MTERGRAGGLGPALLVALLLASMLLGLLVYRARTPNLALEVPRIDRELGERGAGASPVEIEFFVRFDDPEAQVEIVGSGDVTVRTFADGADLAAGERVRCLWDGRDDEGQPVDPGNYRLRVALPAHDRDMVFPKRIAVRRAPLANAPRTAAGCELVATGASL